MARYSSSYKRVSVRINDYFYLVLVCGYVSECALCMGVGSGHPLQSVESIHPVKITVSAQEEETCCHKHISLCLNTDDTEVPYYSAGWRVCVERWLCVYMGVTHMH